MKHVSPACAPFIFYGTKPPIDPFIILPTDGSVVMRLEWGVLMRSGYLVGTDGYLVGTDGVAGHTEVVRLLF